ncbi:MAG: Hsp20/alpha crystallin family protein [Chloroflexaceae bacterium]|nr:Hsp20/alpha crystallin family protein [Chloroflexaceae bacterium]
MMKVTMWEPLQDMMTLNNLMSQTAQRTRQRPTTNVLDIAIDVFEQDESYTVQAVMPGVNPADIDINLNDQVLSIKANCPSQEHAEGTRYHLRERAWGCYERSLRFPVPLNAEGIEAHYEHGILALRLPKSDVIKPRRIPVQAQA